MPVRHSRGFDIEAAARHLRRVDKPLAAWMRRIGPLPEPEDWRRRFDPVNALARAILYQQLHGKAAATITARVEAAAGSRRLHADTLERVSDAELRGCGVSGNKLLALRDLSQREIACEIPTLRAMATMDEDAIIKALVPVRGIGRWTVEMMLMFRLGRPDVLPVDDFGIRKGHQILDGLDAMPSPKETQARGEAWGPYRTWASLYLWKISDFGKGPIPRSQGK